MEIELEEVKRLKEMGMSIAAIARRIGIPRTTLQERLKNHGFAVLRCKECGKEIHGRPRKFCDKHCRNRFFQLMQRGVKVHCSRPHSFFCRLCGVKVDAPAGDRRRLYCSRKCMEYARRVRMSKWKDVVWRHIEKELEKRDEQH